MRVIFRPAALIVAGLLAGCGDGTNRLPVSGTVSWKGQPLPTGMIRFLPLDPAGGSETGAVVTAGKFAVAREQGLAPGRYKVSVSSPDPKSGVMPDAPPGERGGYPATERIAAKYNSKTELTAEVTAGGKNEFDFKLD